MDHLFSTLTSGEKLQEVQFTVHNPMIYCHALALMAKQLCCKNLEDPGSIEALMSCRLIPLDKSPGVRPIGIGEVIRRIIGKSVMFVVKQDVLRSTSYQQLCAGQEAGCEVAIHAVREIFEQEETQGIHLNRCKQYLQLHKSKIIAA